MPQDPETFVETNVLCLENPVHSLSMEQGCHHIHPERESLSEHQPIQRHSLTECGGEDLFGDGKVHDQLLLCKQICGHQLPEGRRPRLSWLREALSYVLGKDTVSKAEQIRPARGLAKVYSPPAHPLRSEFLPHTITYPGPTRKLLQ